MEANAVNSGALVPGCSAADTEVQTSPMLIAPSISNLTFMNTPPVMFPSGRSVHGVRSEFGHRTDADSTSSYESAPEACRGILFVRDLKSGSATPLHPRRAASRRSWLDCRGLDDALIAAIDRDLRAGSPGEDWPTQFRNQLGYVPGLDLHPQQIVRPVILNAHAIGGCP